MGRSLPPLNALRAFEAAGRLGSLTKAARELHVSIAAISRHVAILEDHVGEPLLRRGRGGVTPTDVGQAYLTVTSHAFDQIEATVRSTSGRAGRQLTLAVYPTMTTEWLAPRLVDFRRTHPEVEIEVIVSKPGTRPPDGADLWVTAFADEIGDNPSDVLFETLAALVCAPSLRAGPPPLVRPQDLGEHVLLHAPRERQLWDELLANMGAPALASIRTMQFDTLGLTFQAARGGGGIALGNPFFLVEDLRSGRLVLPFDVVLRFDAPHHLVRSRRRAGDPRVEVLRRWLLGEAGVTAAALTALLDRCRFFDAAGRATRKP